MNSIQTPAASNPKNQLEIQEDVHQTLIKDQFLDEEPDDLSPDDSTDGPIKTAADDDNANKIARSQMLGCTNKAAAKCNDPDPIAMCSDCHCIPKGDQTFQTCPAEVPKTYYPDDLISTLASQLALNPYELMCDPYCDECIQSDGPCETTPPQNPYLVALGEDAVCALHYEQDLSNVFSCRNAEYRMASYASWEEAEAVGGFVTHAGACGVCSTTQDLAAYLRSPDLTTEGKFCSKKGILSYDLGVKCYRDLGFTQACASMWTYNGLNSIEKCLMRCSTSVSRPNNGPAPECALNDCLECDEEESGPMFKQFAARTRRRSGLLSAIARPCDAVVMLTQEDCPATVPL